MQPFIHPNFLKSNVEPMDETPPLNPTKGPWEPREGLKDRSKIFKALIYSYIPSFMCRCITLLLAYTNF